MLGKTSVSMMVLLVVAASLIGISVIHQYVEGQTPPPAGTVVGNIVQVTSYTPVAGCITSVILPTNEPNPLKLKPGTTILLFSERESNCVLLGMLINSETPGSKIIGFKAQKMTVSSLPAVVRGDLGLSANYPNLYRMVSLNIG